MRFNKIGSVKNMKNFLLLSTTILICITLFATDKEASFFTPEENEPVFTQEEKTWREMRHQKMLSPTSWLSIAGLFWLDEGDNSFGTAKECKIRLPQDSAPGNAGKIVIKNEKITVSASPGTLLKMGGRPVTFKEIKSDDTKEPDIIELKDLRIWIIKRGSRYALRLRDLSHAPYRNYQQLEFFPPSKKFKIEATFITYSSLKTITIDTVIGTNTEMKSPGYIKFCIENREFQLVAFEDTPKQLFFIFRDETNGKETYEAGRFLQADLLEKGKVELNFNRAHNPPCAYTPFATCPLPPPENYLNVRIEAGEKKYPGIPH
jgi:hypothetical protein